MRPTFYVQDNVLLQECSSDPEEQHAGISIQITFADKGNKWETELKEQQSKLMNVGFTEVRHDTWNSGYSLHQLTQSGGVLSKKRWTVYVYALPEVRIPRARPDVC